MSVLAAAHAALTIWLLICYFVADQEKQRAEMRQKAAEEAAAAAQAEVDQLEETLEEMGAAEEENAAEAAEAQKELEELRGKNAAHQRRIQDVDDCLLMTGVIGLIAFLTLGILSWIGILARSPLLRAA